MNNQQPLIDVEALAARLPAGDVRIVDCRFELVDTDAGRRAYQQGHIPGAQYVDLERDLSDPVGAGRGRHPLPSVAHLEATFARLGIDDSVSVVAYDAADGMFAARLWWMLRYLGHEAVAVLNGGLAAWETKGYALASGDEPAPQRAQFVARPREDRLVGLDVAGHYQDLVDARDPDRYAGRAEPIDPKAGHIPGARNHFFKKNVDQAGRFLEPGLIKQEFSVSLGTLPNAQTVHYCGSGVSACHNILAQVVAGLPEPRLYCGSWSEWWQRSGSTRRYPTLAAMWP